MIFALSSFSSIFLLLCLLGTVWYRHQGQGRKFLMPAIILLMFYIFVDQMLYSFPQYAHIFISLRLYTQILLCPACLLFSVSFARIASIKDFKRSDLYLFAFSFVAFLLALLLPTSAFYYQTDFAIEPVIFLEETSFYLYLYITIMYVVSLGNLESTLRSTKHSDQWKIKLAIVGFALGFTGLMFFAMQGLLYKTVDIRNIPLRNFAVCIGLILVLYAEWKRNSNEVFISRRVVFRSFLAIFAGLYFIGMGIAREGTRLFGENFSQKVFIIAAVIILCIAITTVFSQKLRRALVIWIQRNFYNEKYDYRAQWMQFSKELAHATDYNSFINSSLMSFCETFGRIGAIYISVDTEYPNSMGQSFYYEIDKESKAIFMDEDFLQIINQNPCPLFVNDDECISFTSHTSVSLARMQVDIILPIHAADTPEGLLLLGPPINEKEKYDNEDFELMEAMGRQIGLSAKSFRISELMALSREIKAIDKLGTFVLHDLKNQVYALSLLTNNARNFIKKPEFQADMLETLSSTVGNMKKLISQLAHFPESESLHLEETYLQDLAKKIATQIPHAPIKIKGENPSIVIDSEQIGKVFFNLYLNALEAGDNKPITVIIGEEDNIPFFQVIDNAGGLPPQVIEAGVFKPFNTTKERGMGIGLYHSRKIVEAHGARISVEDRPGEGCTFTVRFENISKK